MKPLECCLERKNYYALHVLLNRGANLTTEEHGKYLIQAAIEGRNEVVKLLLEKGVNANFKDKLKETALFKSVRSGYYHTSEILIKYGAKVKSKNHEGITVIDLAREKKSQILIKLLDNAPEIRRAHENEYKLLEGDKGINRFTTRTSYKSNTSFNDVKVNYARKTTVQEININDKQVYSCCLIKY